MSLEQFFSSLPWYTLTLLVITGVTVVAYIIVNTRVLRSDVSEWCVKIHTYLAAIIVIEIVLLLFILR